MGWVGVAQFRRLAVLAQKLESLFRNKIQNVSEPNRACTLLVTTADYTIIAFWDKKQQTVESSIFV